MEIREPHPDEHHAWLTMRERLWPDYSRADLAHEQAQILADESRNIVFVAAAPSGELAGFVEVSLRDWAEGCTTHPVGYVEAWYVEAAHRQSGLGRRLIEAAERWAIARGCTEMASDADLHNDVSHRAHRALRYTEVGRAVLFSKRLAP